MVAFATLCATTRGDEPLNVKIDAMLEASHPAGQAALANDGEFLRRAHLALHGLIPTAAEARAFFADTAADKRTKVVDALIADPQFAKWLAVRLDVMLMERRGETHTKALPWREWLEQSVAANKPWDVLVKELLVADGANEKTRHTGRWMLERDCDPNALTKDAARLFLGRDISCAQCHDHPRIDDYRQRDYAGLQAFFSRTSFFRPDANKPGVVGEQAAGDVAYMSVFTKVGGETKPRLPGGAELAETAPGEWAVAPDPKDKNVRPIPKVSRRSLLADALPGDPAFRKNIANRLWAIVFGRGLVEPLDVQHSANPPSNPELLDMLGAQIAAMKFDMRAFMRELALTRAFQRSFDLPELPPEVAKAAAEKLTAIQQEAATLASAVAALESDAQKADKAMIEARRAAQPIQAERQKQDAAVAEAKKAVDAAVAEQKKSDDNLAAKRDAQRLLAEAAAKVGEAVAKAGESPELTAAAKTFQTKADTTAKDIPAAEKDAAAKKGAADARSAALAAAGQVAEAAKAKADEAAKGIAAEQAAFEAAAAKKSAERIRAKNAATLAAQAKAALDWVTASSAGRPALDAAAKAEADFAAAKQAVDQVNAEVAAAPAKLAGLESGVNLAMADLTKAKEGMTAKGPAAAALAEAAAKAAEAAAKLPADAEVKNAAAAVKAKADGAAAEVAAIQKSVGEAQAKADVSAQALAEAKAATEKAKADIVAKQSQLAPLEASAKAARVKADEALAAIVPAQNALAAAWGRSFASTDLLPLSPEQLCWSLMRSTGMLDIIRDGATKEFDKKTPLTDADKADPAKVAARLAAIEKAVRDQLRPHETHFARAFGGAAGQPQTDFFATPEQALYFENDGTVRGWAGVLAGRAAGLPDAKASAEELYLSLLTRMPTASEIAELTATIAARPADKKNEALTNCTWALVTSTEFRFSH